MRKVKIKDTDPILQEMKKMQKSQLDEQEALKNLLKALKKNSPEHKSTSGKESGNEM
ncbi:MAG TPA: hypothetical protein VK212_03130 [Lentimicrobium sp.]|nr:hypothetical protein [Lentimicrobium sp.]